MNVVDLILEKRNGGNLRPEQILELIAAYTAGDVPDYQMSAFLMATFLKGMSRAEAVALTDAMLHSGEILDLSGIPGIKVDKHSTGGVGDKVSLILAPVVAACGVPVPMISGRGLGHTGGTLDKLESIPGFSTDMELDSYRLQLREIGIVMIGQTKEIAPADRKMYALRDVTGTVEFIPFIAASIMSKKLAEGIDALVLDVKCGSGAFMREEADARELAETLVGIGDRFGISTVAWMTDMSAPLGRSIGNWPEVREAIRCLRGETVTDLMEVTLTLAGEMIVLGGKADTLDAGMKLAQDALDSGAAFELFLRMVDMQGGDTAIVERPELRDDKGPLAVVHASQGAGPFVGSIDALALGRAAVALGAGRQSKEDVIDSLAGISLAVHVGDAVESGDVLAKIYAQDPERASRIVDAVASAFSFTEQPPKVTSRLLNRYSVDGWLNPGTTPSV